MKLPKDCSLYLIYDGARCYFSEYVAYYDNKQYIVLKNKVWESYDIVLGISIYRLDTVFDELVYKIDMANTKHIPIHISLKSMSGSFEKFIILPGGGMTSNQNPGSPVSVVNIPFNHDRINYCVPKIYVNYVDMKPCTADGTTYTSYKASGYSKSCNRVYECIKENPSCSTEEIIDILGLPANRVTPRLTELVKAGRIEVYQRFHNPSTGRMMSSWVAKD